MTATVLPKEHGAYGQMALPLLTAMAVSGPSLAAMAVVAGFLAHEPWLVLLGSRGTRARREAGPRAARWLSALIAVGGVAAVLGWQQTPADRRWTFVLPCVPAVVVAWESARGRPKSVAAELAAAVAFSMAAVPAVTSAGGSPVVGLSVALPFVVVFAAATLAVRAVTRWPRTGERPDALASPARCRRHGLRLRGPGLGEPGHAVAVGGWGGLGSCRGPSWRRPSRSPARTRGT
ncbi:MAG: YwiC-like family protein [Vicinamibacterales bacterium]